MAAAATADNLDDLRIRGIRPLVPSACLIDDVSGDSAVYACISQSRRDIARAVRGDDTRLLVVVGPVSLHDPVAAMEYARKLAVLREKHSDDLIIVMRTFLDEPTGGAGYWSGAMYDPDLDGSFQINRGLRQARQLLLDINRLGLPVGCLYCDTISPQFIADLVAWSCISSYAHPPHPTPCRHRPPPPPTWRVNCLTHWARHAPVGRYSAQSVLHLELASGLSTPVGFAAIGEGKRAAEIAVDAVQVAGAPHAFLSISKQGVAGIVETTGNPDCHPVLPPGDENVSNACKALNAAGRAERVMVECPTSAAATHAAKDKRVVGLLLPSFLKGGAQVLRPNDPSRVYGMSVTEPCLDWDETAKTLADLATAVRKRRTGVAPALNRSSSAEPLSAFVEVKELGPTDNLHVNRIRPLLAAAVCIEEYDANAVIKQQVFDTRCEVSALLHGESDRLLVVVGPSSITDTSACMEYAARLRTLAAQLDEELVVIMQVNLAEAAGASSLMKDPERNGSFQINRGFCQARQLLIDVNQLGLPVGCEFLDTITPQFIADLVSWGYVGERTCANRAHRELASGLSMPVGFVKDSVRDAIRKGERVALDAVRASGAPHAFLSCSKQGVAGIVETTGNSDCHVVLPAEHLSTLAGECEALGGLQLPARVMVRCNAPPSAPYSQGAHVEAARGVASLVGSGNEQIIGVLLPSFLVGGKADVSSGGAEGACHGMSVTEPCLDWCSTAQVMEELAAAVRQRRASSAKAKKARVA